MLAIYHKHARLGLSKEMTYPRFVTVMKHINGEKTDCEKSQTFQKDLLLIKKLINGSKLYV